MKKITLFLSALVLSISTAHAAPLQVKTMNLERLKMNPVLRTLPNLDGLHLSAGNGLVKYHKLVNQSNFRIFGLKSAAEAQSSNLGHPVRDYMVRLDALKAYVPGSNPIPLLTDTHMVHYPVVTGGKSNASMTMGFEGGQWQLVSVGDSNRTLKLHTAISSSSVVHRQLVDNHFNVRIPALNLEFAGVYDAKGMLFLTPIIDSAEFGLRAGISEQATAIFGRLVQAAKSHDGMPH
jgi:hypothetical protein